jgi:hypothetical protein
MDYQFTNLTDSDVSRLIEVTKKVSEEDFPELKHKYAIIEVVFFRADNMLGDKLEKEVNDFIGGSVISLNETSALRTTSAPPKACLQIELSTFETYPSWKQSFSLRHEFAHMIKKEESKALSNLISEYGVDKMRSFVRYENEFGVHLLMIEKWQDDWLKEPVGFNDSLPNPALATLSIRKTKGKKEAMLFCVQNIVHLLTLIKLYDNVSDDKKGQVRVKKRMAKQYLQSFNGALKVDSKNFPESHCWFDKDDFLTQTLYYQKIGKLLALMENA